MTSGNLRFRDGRMGSALTIRVIPNSESNNISDILDDGTLQVQLIASQGDERVNTALKKFLAQILDVPVRKIEIIAGEEGPDKLIAILDTDAEEIQNRIIGHL